MLFLLASANLFCQEKPGDKKLRKSSPFDLRNYKPESKDKVILELNHCGWLNMPNGVRNDILSRGANFYLYFDYPFGNSNYSFAWGAGVASHNVSGNANVIYQLDSLGNEKTFFEKRILPYRKNVIGAKIIEIPFELRFRTRRARSFKMTLGFKVGYTVQNFRKIFDVDGKRKYFDIHNYNSWRYGVVFRIGYEQIYLCGFYSLSELIRKGKGSAGIIPYTVGIGISPW
jgi:hypothetical protein